MNKKSPEFSWDTIPRYMHVWKKTSFTEEELDYLAQFQLITFEKAQGVEDGSYQEGTLKAAREVKERNPNAKILYYRNIVIDWRKELETMEDGYLQSTDGTYPTVNPNIDIRFFDISRPDVQDWWMKDAAQMLSDDFIDGLFIDANIKVLHHEYFPIWKKVGEEKAGQLRAGYEKILDRIEAELRPENIILANIIRARLPNGGMDYLERFDGSYLEGFEENVDGVSRPDYMARGIAYAQEAARQGKMIAFTVGLGEAVKKDSSGIGLDETRGKIEDIDAVRERLDYVTALFLVIAEEYSYFYPHGGYGVGKGEEGRQRNPLWLVDLPVFNKKLGPPKGPAAKDGYIYTREFEHCSVWLDIENEAGTLIWR